MRIEELEERAILMIDFSSASDRPCDCPRDSCGCEDVCGCDGYCPDDEW